MRVIFISVVVFIASMFSIGIQAQRNCGTMDVLDRQVKENPGMLRNMQDIEKQVQEFLRKNPNGTGTRATITIPTVFHIVYNAAAPAENISDAQIQSQIDALNLDYQALNSDLSLTPALFTPVIGNPEINFCLAVQAPGGVATTGIERRSSTVASWGTTDNVKRTAQGGLDPWNPANYLNIWVCNIGGGILGYAQFPGGSAATDGVVLDYRYTGTIGTATAPYHKGRTATHEIGHWLNLRHIWGDATCGDDLVGDTPVHNAANFGCPVYPHLSTCAGTPVEMTMNYMDYTYDACMEMFSAGQKLRMRSVLENGGARASLQTSPGCIPVNPNACNAPSGLAASSITTTGAIVSWTASANATSYTFDYKQSTSATWISQNTTSLAVTLTGLTPNTVYNTRVLANCSNGSSAYSATVNFTTLAVVSCTDNYETNNSNSQAKAITPGTAITAKIGTSTDVDWFKFSNTNAQKNIKVNLSNLPANYDVKLYKGNTLLGTSANTGTTNEQIIYNTTAKAASYYVQVYGVGGAFNADQCYTLLVQLSAGNFRTFESNDDEINAEPVKDEFLVFPNPAYDFVTIVAPFKNDSEGTVSLIDVTGKNVLTQKLSGVKGNNTYNVNISDVSDGIYFIQLKTGTETFTQKMAVSKN